MKLIFMGTPEFAVPALEALIAAGHDIVAVYSQPPRPAGRGQKEQKSPVHIRAEENNIPVKTPASLKSESEQDEFRAFGADAAIVAAYGLILPKAIINACRCINIHASLLPRWRGAAPIQRAILAGDRETGVTIMDMNSGLDTGDMLFKDKIQIDRMTAGELHDALGIMGAKLIVEALDKLDEIIPEKQPDNATYAEKISKDEAKINWNKKVTEIERQIRAFNPFPGAFFEYNGEKIKILFANYIENPDHNPAGQVIGDKLEISASDGVILPRIVQRQGKKAMPTEQLLRGFKIPSGTKLS